MTNRFLLSVAAAALIGGTSLAYAQGAGHMAPSAGAGAQQSAPAANAPAARGESSDTGNANSDMNKSEDSGPHEGGRNQHAQEHMKGEKGAPSKSAQEEPRGTKSKSSEMNNKSDKSEMNNKAADKDMKPEDRKGNSMKAEDHNGMKSDSKSAAEGKSSTTKTTAEGKSSTTTGQASAGAKLSTEQRTKITTVIKNEHIRPETNVNFSISIGTRVPREVHFHPLPTEIITVYPDWRGYEFFLVSDQIIVVNPRTLEIVAVLDV